MPRSPSRLLPALALVTLVLVSPTRATALPQSATLRSVAEHSEGPGLISRLWDVLFAVWTTGSILDPDGPNAGGAEPIEANSGDTGSGLDPDGRP